MKKILSILVCVCVLLSAMVITASAAETSATISFADTANRTTSTTSQQIWEQNGITVTYDKAGYNSNLAEYDSPARFYKGTNVTVAYPGMTKLVIDCTNVYADKIEPWGNSFDTTLGTAVIDGTTVTITLNSAVDSLVFSMSAQARAMSMTVYAEATTGGNEPSCEHTAKSAVPNGDETHKLVCDACSETVTPAVNCVDADVNGKCDVCAGDVAVPFDPTGKTAAEIVDAAYALTGSETIENVTLKGKIVKLDYAYNAEHGNITVTIAVEGADAEKTIQCFRMTGENIADLTYDDVITVTGTIKNYKGTIEFDKPVCTAVEKAVVENNDPAADSVLTIKEALELGASKKHNVYTENKYYVTGKITAFSGEQGKTYGNIIITDDEGNEILVYGTYDETGEIRYDALENPPVEGDTVTVYGVIGQYNGTAQMKNGWFKAAPVVDDDDDTTGGTTGGTTTGGTTGGATGGATTDKDTNADKNTNTDKNTTSPATGDNVGAFAVMAIAAAAVVIAASKKRA